MIDIEFFRIGKYRGVTLCWHCEPTVEFHTTMPAQFTIGQCVLERLLHVCWRAIDHLLLDTVQCFLSIFQYSFAIPAIYLSGRRPYCVTLS